MNLFQAVYAASGLTLATFGSVAELIQPDSPWYGFDSDEAALLVVRIEKLAPLECRKWLPALVDTLPEGWQEIKVPNGKPGSPETKEFLKSFMRGWEPWKPEELAGIRDCDDLPCSVKFNKNEIALLGASSKEERFAKFRDLVFQRVTNYQSSDLRDEFEFPGELLDPWDYLEKRGYVSPMKRPAEKHLGLRKLDLSSGEAKIIRQFLDRRAVRNTDDTQATVWVRDAYNDHYFDSWGEWSHVVCNPQLRAAASLEAPLGNYIIQALMIELDLLKKTDLISKLMRGKMRSAFKDNAQIYLDHQFSRIKATAAETIEVAPALLTPPKVPAVKNKLAPKCKKSILKSN